MKLHLSQNREKIFSVVLLFGLISYAAIFSFLSIRNHELYQTFAWDLGFFDQLLWQASQGKINFVSTIGNINLIGDHFQPILYLVTPLYLLWSDVRIMLIAQAVIVASAAVPIFLLAKSKLSNVFLAASLAVAYLFYLGTQFTITNEFHQSAFIPLLLSLGLHWLESGKPAYGRLTILALFFVREDTGLLIAALGITYLLRHKIQTGLTLLLSGIFGFFFLIHVVIPAVSSQGKYIHFGYGDIGFTPGEVIANVIRNPTSHLSKLYSPPKKITQVRNSLLTFGGLPFFSPLNLIPVVQQYAIRFIDSRTIHRWLDVNHYAAPIGPLMAFASIIGLESLKQKFGHVSWGRLTTAIAIYLLAVVALTNILLHGPILSIFKNQLYFTPQWARNADELVAQIPDGAKVAANNSLVPHLSHRDTIYLLPQIHDADYIAIDLESGPNKYAPKTFEDINSFLDSLSQDKWQLIHQTGEAMLFKHSP